MTTTSTAQKPGKRKLARNREILELAKRVKFNEQGQRVYVRFSLAEQIEHQVLIVSFTALVITGLPQRYADTFVGAGLLQLMGGIDMVQSIHHLFAALFILEAFYHIGAFVYKLVAKGNFGSLWPAFSDFKHFWQIIKFNLGVSKERPHFQRFTFEEKVEYWALIWGGAVMIITGLIQWFPVEASKWLTGGSVPVSRTVHSWEALLAALSILTWHMYHTVIKMFNKSIFNGVMTEAEMTHDHAAEKELIDWAYQEVDKARRRQAEVVLTQADE